ncbi:MAG: hypothetical protein JW760_11265 [Spirochaetales bacterium]|nr:hypothetical protein [Spirochaetales bacterium]
MEVQRKKVIALGLTGILFFLLFLFLIPFLDPLHQSSQVWKGYYMLLLSPRSPGNVEGALSEAGFSCVSRENTSLPFSDYTGMIDVPLKDLDLRFLPIDPRVKDYAKNVGSYFTSAAEGETREIMYIESNDSPWIFSRKVKQALGSEKDAWIIADYSRRGTILMLCLYGLMVVFFFFRTKLPKPLPFVMALPGALLIFLGTGQGGFSPILLYCAFITAMEYSKPVVVQQIAGEPFRPGFWLLIGCMLLLSIIVSLVLSTGDGGRVYAWSTVGILSLAFLSLGLSYGTFLMIKYGAMEHRLFVPLLIFEGPERNYEKGAGGKIVIIAALLALSLVIPRIPDGREGFPVPEPVSCPGVEDFSWQSLLVLEKQDNRGTLPDLTDYLTHLAYQEGFMYNRQYTFPEPGEEVTLTRYIRDGDSIFSTAECVKQFTEHWYEDIMFQASENGITRVLLKQEHPSGVTIREIKKLSLVPQTVREQLLIGVIAFSPFAGTGILSWEPEDN